MNKNWIDFLKSNNATINPELEISFPKNQQSSEHTVTPVTHLSVLKITGTDAAQFLQGQLTCNINNLSDSTSFYSAFCNAKGQTITTLLIYKKNNEYFIVLPTELTDKVITKLHMYILRSAVKIQNVTDNLCLIGLTSSNRTILPSLPKNQFEISQSTIQFSSRNDRYLIINPEKETSALWTQLIHKKNVVVVNSSSWKFQDISEGIPWLNLATSEEYIPQMLNIDKLGGISFDKGCYTGQEIVARTHYLGKTKRELCLAECHSTAMLEGSNQIVMNNSKQVTGKVLSIQSNDKVTRMLTVMQNSDTELQNLTLDTPNMDKINLIDFY
ncbi:MAG: folate-binding protein [Methylococcaceae bacterium]|nr:folate-binding protein [Methylococcaceae bacterium]